MARLGRAAADLGLHRVELADAHERLRFYRLWAGGGQLVEAPAHVAPAEGEPHLALVGQGAIGRVAVHLLHAVEAGDVG